MTRFFSLLDFSGRTLDTIYEIFHTTLTVSDPYKQVEGPWTTVSPNDPKPRLVLLQNHGGHPDAIKYADPFSQDMDRDTQLREKTTIFHRHVSTAEMVNNATPFAPLLSGKILPNIAHFDVDYSIVASASETNPYDASESCYSSESSEVLFEPLRPITNTEKDPASCAPASDGQRYHTALGVPPLHHKGVARSKVLHEPEDELGICPIHGCKPCMSCLSQNKPLLFPF